MVQHPLLERLRYSSGMGAAEAGPDAHTKLQQDVRSTCVAHMLTTSIKHALACSFFALQAACIWWDACYSRFAKCAYCKC